ncbi:MAG TPA: hypothetical protein PLE99_07930 [Candidatus Thiothrix moscowensis]|uniref:hypothetical protein n=1 Tax=unclassified Thiothrix TaxID=2636184 RepID=UPI0025F1364A|nr:MULTISPECIES: hypothetical protein [unclassified Thiothrix]HRJ52681.1 hypothetical protein [Candidatus Thiothrix moscowensis]HRJ92835.1 hypothetical protein [Candidatus Thiothrix moscowensis]
MAAIDDLIAQIEDKTLRERLRLEMGRITKEKKFGLVFEDHLPELTPVYSARVRKAGNGLFVNLQLELDKRLNTYQHKRLQVEHMIQGERA